MQESRIISNASVGARARRRGVPVALWGHGINLQDDIHSFANGFKRLYSKRVDWWFAYTAGVAKLVSSMGFPKERVTIVNNAIDTQGLMRALQSVTHERRESLRVQLGLGTGPIGIFCGGMYPEKRLGFLFEACDLVRRSIPDFQVILIGAGPDQRHAAQFAASRGWARYLGPVFGVNRVPYFALAQLFLMPGLVGLAILDSFALGTPIVTTSYPHHSPEIEYLVNGVNGLISEENTKAYATAIINALQNQETIPRLRANAKNSANTYTIEAMVENFADGVIRALSPANEEVFASL
jgi:glycosyltransferase involved in cell wall biosynthesis